MGFEQRLRRIRTGVCTTPLRAMCLVAVLLAPFRAGAAGQGCEGWAASLGGWDRKVEEITGGEIEQVSGRIREAVEARQEGNAGRVVLIADDLARRRAALSRLTPPSEVARAQELAAAHLRAVEDAVRAAASPSLDLSTIPRSEALRRLPLRPVYATLLAHEREMLSLLEAHACNAGNIDALRNKLIPATEKALASLAR